MNQQDLAMATSRDNASVTDTHEKLTHDVKLLL